MSLYTSWELFLRCFLIAKNVLSSVWIIIANPLSANPIKWSDTLKRFVIKHTPKRLAFEAFPSHVHPCSSVNYKFLFDFKNLIALFCVVFFIFPQSVWNYMTNVVLWIWLYFMNYSINLNYQFSTNVTFWQQLECQIK